MGVGLHWEQREREAVDDRPWSSVRTKVEYVPLRGFTGFQGRQQVRLHLVHVKWSLASRI